MLRNVLPLFVIAVFIGWFMPGSLPDNGGNAVGPAKPAANVAVGKASVFTDADLRVGGTEGGKVVLDRQGDGHFYANVDVEGRDVRFMVDTGATGLALTGDDARSLGLSWFDSELEIVGRGVSGPVLGKRVVLRDVRLGGIEASNIEAAIIPDGLTVSLLGQSFLSKAETVNISGNKMILD